ncbi:MAG: GGDEF domain-containing response regulator [Planctomycetes bacterium]|nr:GGDEF domain-containing response regulator [Planctomycetota bacterium]
MTQAVTQNFADNTINRPALLLLGDDGRMLNLLRSWFGHYRIVSADSALDGILQLGESASRLVLVNAETTGIKTADVVKALRRVRPGIKVVIYGEPFAEQYSQAAMKAGASDYLVWPIPPGELEIFLGTPAGRAKPESIKNKVVRQETPKLEPIRSEPARVIKKEPETKPEPKPALEPELESEPEPKPAPEPDLKPAEATPGQNILAGNGIKSNGSILTGAADSLQYYRQWAQLVPKGRRALIEHSEKMLAEMLGLEWVRIYPTDNNNGYQAPKAESDDPGAHRIVVMRGPMGPAGEMQLGPAVREELSRPAIAQQAADYLGTLMHLVNRDKSLKVLATVDELTGAYNRRYLEYFLRRMIEQSKLEHTDVTLLLFDIDNFKHYNDTYGHTAGDNILRQATKLMRRCCRVHDVVARMGGDEFAVLFWDTHGREKVYEHQGEEAATTPELTLLKQSVEHEDVKVDLSGKSHAELAVFMSNRFRRMMHKSEFPGLGPEALGRLTISGGLAHFPLDSSSVGELLAKADEALLTAKRNGKNRLYLVGRPTEPLPPQ